jgi:hypothetical protein
VYLLLGRLDLVLGRLFEVLDVVGIEHGAWGHGCRRRAAPLQQRQLAQALLQPLAPAAERLVDRFRRRGEAPLQDREREADRAGALVVLQRLGAVELLAHVLGDVLVQVRLRGRELVRHRVGDALREERRAVELAEALLDHAPHQVGGVDPVHTVAEAALEPIAIEQREEELEVLLLAVVGRGRHQEEVARQAGDELAEPVSLRVLDLAAE